MTGAGDRSIDLLFGGRLRAVRGLGGGARGLRPRGRAGRRGGGPAEGRGPGWGVGKLRFRPCGGARRVPRRAKGGALAEVIRDVEDFARALAQDGRNDRLGWS